MILLALLMAVLMAGLFGLVTYLYFEASRLNRESLACLNEAKAWHGAVKNMIERGD